MSAVRITEDHRGVWTAQPEPAAVAQNRRVYQPGVVVRAAHLVRALEAREQARRALGTGECVTVQPPTTAGGQA